MCVFIVFKCYYQGDPKTIKFDYKDGGGHRHTLSITRLMNDRDNSTSVQFKEREEHGLWEIGWAERTEIIQKSSGIKIAESCQALERPCIVLRVDFNARKGYPDKQHIFSFDWCNSKWVLLQINLWSQLWAETTMELSKMSEV